LHQAANNVWIARVATDKAMRSKLKQVAYARYRGACGWRFESGLLCRFITVADHEMIDLI